MTTTTFSIPEIHCMSCEALIRLSLKKLPGIKQSSIMYKAKTATIEYDDKLISKEKIKQQIVSDTGYAVS